MAYILSLDQGTTSSRSILFGKDGNIVAHGQREFKQIYPQGGWVEHDPMEIWGNTEGVIAEAMARARLEPHQLAAVGHHRSDRHVLVLGRTLRLAQGEAHEVLIARKEVVAHRCIWQPSRRGSATSGVPNTS